MGFLDRLKQWLGSSPKDAPAPPTPPTQSPSPSADATDAHVDEPLETAAAPVPAGPPDGKERRHQDRQPPADGVRVLIVDDSPTIVTMLSRMLEQNGYLVSEAGDAETGMEIARNTPPHLIFLDIVLPGMNGFEALRRLRRDPVTRTIPVIMISGNELATEQFYAQRIGADDFMKKPFSRAEVFLRVEKLLGPDRVPMPHVIPTRR